MDRRSIARSFLIACVLCASITAAFVWLLPDPPAPALWALTIGITYLVSRYQRRTGRGFGIPAAATIGGARVTTHLPTSSHGGGDCTIRLSPALAGPPPMLVYRRYPTSEPWTRVPFVSARGEMIARVPRQPAAGKVEYHIEFDDDGTRRTLPHDRNVNVRFRGSVSVGVLIPHVVLILLGMMLSLRAGLETYYDGPRQTAFMVAALASLVGGGMIFGPLVQKAAFGKYWTGIPFGHDLTDNKTLIAVTAWVVALGATLLSWEFAPELRLVASGLSLMAFLIPHSLLGSELRYDDEAGSVTVAPPVPAAPLPAEKRRVTVGPATADDEEAIRALVGEAHINPTSLEWRYFTVARHPDVGLVGCVQLRDAPLGAGREMRSLVVREGFRDGAITRAMLRALSADEPGPIWGTCVESLVPFYRRFGCEVPARSETPLYFRAVLAGAAVLRMMTHGRMPRIALMRYVPARGGR